MHLYKDARAQTYMLTYGRTCTKMHTPELASDDVTSSLTTRLSFLHVASRTALTTRRGQPAHGFLQTTCD